MRPYIEISHSKNGRVKDLASLLDKSTPEMYDTLISSSLERFEALGRIDWDQLSERHDLSDDELAAAKAVVEAVAAGAKTKAQIVETVKPEHEAGKGSDDWWWRSIVANVLLDEEILEDEHGMVVRLAE